MAISAIRLSCWLLLVYSTCISCVSAEDSYVTNVQKCLELHRTVSQPIFSIALVSPVVCPPGCVIDNADWTRNETYPFIVVPTPVIIVVVGPDNACLDPRIQRLMLGRKQLSKEFTEYLQDGRLRLTRGRVDQRITFNSNTKLKVFRQNRRGHLTVLIPCVVPIVVFTFRYNLEQNGRETSGTVEVELFDKPVQIEVIVQQLEDGTCSLKWAKSVIDKVLESYNVKTSFKPDSWQDLGLVSGAVNKLLIEGWLYPAYLSQMRVFVYEVVKEALMQYYRVIQLDILLRESCTVIRGDSPVPGEPTREPPPEDPEPTRKPRPTRPTPRQPGTTQDCDPLQINVVYNEKH